VSSQPEANAAAKPLTGYTVAVTAERRRGEFGEALVRNGATVVYAPAIHIVPLADDSQLLAATRACLSAQLDIVVATTGVGFRGWVEAADKWGLKDDLRAAFDGARILARGPKARGAIRACGLREQWSPPNESSSEMLEHLKANDDLTGMRIAVQLHGDPLPDMVDTLRGAGAEVIEVPVYRWVPPDDIAPLQRLMDDIVAGHIDCVTFTSAPAATSFLQVADSDVRGEAIRRCLEQSVVVACVGPVTAEPLLRKGITVIQPARGRLGALVREIVEQLPRRGQRFRTT
jgi:uroporphyrinogen-III synthase